MTAQIGDDGLDLLGDPLPELLTEVAGVQPQPGGEWVHLKDKLGFRSIQRLGSETSPAAWWWRRGRLSLRVQARYLYGRRTRLGSRGCCDRARMDSHTVAPHRVLLSVAGQTAVHASAGRAA